VMRLGGCRPCPCPRHRAKYAHRHYVFETDQEAANKAKPYADSHDVELWEGTRQVALLTRGNLPSNSGGFLLLRPRRRRAGCLGTISGRGAYVHVSSRAGTSVC